MEVFVARQPIFDRNLKVIAYELLYRSSYENTFVNHDPDKATYEVISNSLLLIGIEALTGGKKAFINFTGNLLVDKIMKTLPKHLIAIEILENVEPDAEIINVCRELKELGYLIVLDDFVYHPKIQSFIELADIVKVDFLSTASRERSRVLGRFDRSKVKFLAEKVETKEDFEQGFQLGYEYFQGYFFSKPVIVKGRDISSYKMTYLKIIQEINHGEPDFNRIAEIIARDVSLSYKLLHYINSAAFGIKTSIQSIKHALVLLGTEEVKKWVTLIVLRGIGMDKPDEIMRTSAVRAKFGELLASLTTCHQLANEFFLMGLFSMIDALVDRPIYEIMCELPVPEGVQKALLGKPGFHRRVYTLVVSYEKGRWEEFNKTAAILNINIDEVPKKYLAALDWADQLISMES